MSETHHGARPNYDAIHEGPLSECPSCSAEGRNARADRIQEAERAGAGRQRLNELDDPQGWTKR
jgi:hypothetical protein